MATALDDSEDARGRQGATTLVKNIQTLVPPGEPTGPPDPPGPRAGGNNGEWAGRAGRAGGPVRARSPLFKGLRLCRRPLLIPRRGEDPVGPNVRSQPVKHMSTVLPSRISFHDI